MTPVDVVIAAGTLLTAALLGLSIHAKHRTRRQALIDTAAEAERRLEDQAMRLGNSWRNPPCSHEDNWCTGECLIEHLPRGKHHAVWSVPLDYQPKEVILAVVTDLQRRQR